MQRIGRALLVSSSRNLILKAKKIPKLGDEVVDRNLVPIGKVFDIFGPVISPYISVKPIIEEPHRLIGRVLYATSSKHSSRRIRRRK